MGATMQTGGIPTDTTRPWRGGTGGGHRDKEVRRGLGGPVGEINNSRQNTDQPVLLPPMAGLQMAKPKKECFVLKP